MNAQGFMDFLRVVLWFALFYSLMYSAYVSAKRLLKHFKTGSAVKEDGEKTSQQASISEESNSIIIFFLIPSVSSLLLIVMYVLRIRLL